MTRTTEAVPTSDVFSYSKVFVNTGDPIEQEDLLEFRLLYEGPVHASSNKNTHTAEKHEIRRSLHPQIRRLWHMHKGLRQLAENAGNRMSQGLILPNRKDSMQVSRQSENCGLESDTNLFPW